MDVVAEFVKAVFDRRSETRGLQMVYEPKYLRFFQCAVRAYRVGQRSGQKKASPQRYNGAVTLVRVIRAERGSLMADSNTQRPLADAIRPESLDDFVGQAHLVGPGQPLAQAIAANHVFSMIFWGPPGVGKTTLARILARQTGRRFHELSAVSAGKGEIRDIVEGVRKERAAEPAQRDLFSTVAPEAPQAPPPTPVLFLDEIHRFNKAQQDFLLPYVEDGTLILIGATTENPSFEVIPALLSRCRVFVLNPLTDEEVSTVLARGAAESRRGAERRRARISG